MVAISRCFGSVALFLAGTEGARISRKRASDASAPSAKFIAGVPVLNYHTAYGGKASLGELESEEEEDWVVMMNSGTSDAQMQNMCKSSTNGCKIVSKGGAPFVELSGTEKDLERLIQEGAGVAKFVEPDQKIFAIPELYADVEAATWGLNRIGADSRGRGGAGANVFILDTGVRVSHEEFSGRAAPMLDVTIGNPVLCNGDLSCAVDRQGHGTHCAGSAAGVSFGVAPSARVYGVKVLGDGGSGSLSGISYALNWMGEQSIRPAVASMSLGASGVFQSFRTAVDATVNAGVVVVVASGNSNSDACRFSPAFVPSAITVGSTTVRDQRSSFSNYGPCVDIWGPGSNIKSASHRSDTGSATMSGTSMACPHVAGAAALVHEAGPSQKPSAVVETLLNNAVRGFITGLRTGDTNALLYVGESA